MTLWMGGSRFALRVSGPDAIDLLHRVTSNEVRGLAVGASNHQCLLTAKGKIVSIFDLERLLDGAVLTGPLELKEVTLAALDRYIIADQVLIEELPDRLPDGDPSRTRDSSPTGDPSRTQEGEDERIRAGEARWGVDIDSETIPLEAGLDAWVTTSKGCYTGQETIARIETYGQVARKLCRLRSTNASSARGGSPVGDGSTVGDAAGSSVGDLFLDGAAIGALTSVTSTADKEGARCAIGILRRAAWPEGTVLTALDGVSWKVLG